MRGDDAERAVTVEALEQRLGQCAADEWLCTATELVDEQQRALVAVTDEVLHVRQVRAVGAEVVFDALFVADIDEDTLEDARARALVQGDGDAALEHVL